jgi:hypothetical protein
LIVLDLPGCTSATPAAMEAWIRKRRGMPGLKAAIAAIINRQAKPADQQRELDYFPAGCWRPAVPEDLIDALNFNEIVWQVRQHFTFEQIAPVASKWWPTLLKRWEAAIAIADPNARRLAYARCRDLSARMASLSYIFDGCLNDAQRRILHELEMRDWQAFAAQPFEFQKCCGLLKRFSSHETLHLALQACENHLAHIGRNPAAVLAALKDIEATQVWRKAPIQRQQTFWRTVAPHVPLPPTLSGATLDISDATEERVELNMRLVNAGRVGMVKPGRMALHLTRDGKDVFIAGERKLKFKVGAAGGRLEKSGNVLLVSAQGAGKLAGALLAADRIDTLSNLDPDQALTLLKEKNLPPSHPAFEAARKAKTDLRYARILSDLLIEEAIGIDADVARRLMKAQSRGGRKR